VTEKKELRSNLTSAVSREFNISSLRMLSTSGSTGKPLNVFISKKEDLIRKIKHVRANMSCGQKLWDKWAAITSPSHFSEVSGFHRKIGFFSPIFISVFESTEAQLSKIEKIKPDVLGGYSSSLVLLAKESEKRGSNEVKPRIIFSGAELLDDKSRLLIEKTFNAPVYDQYAIIELERVAWQCCEKKKYHIDADFIITQFIDKNCEEVSAGERGSIVCTSLFNYAMPLIRYAVGDIGVPSDEICSCGRSLPLMGVIEGRRDSLLSLPGGRLLSPRTMTITMNSFELSYFIDQFRIIQRKPSLIDIYVKLKEDKKVDNWGFKRKLLAHIERSLNLSASEEFFEIEFVENLPLDKSGKFSSVISELDCERNEK
ncbi:MAG: hypothetical protein QXT06_05410, partial [Candidatus Bathyarchaeia archaeon]